MAYDLLYTLDLFQLHNQDFFSSQYLAGHPATIAPWGTLLLTNEFPAIITSSSITTGPAIITLGPPKHYSLDEELLCMGTAVQ